MKFKCDMIGGIDNHFGEYPGKVLICVDSVHDVITNDYSNYDKKVFIQIEPPEIQHSNIFTYVCQNHGLFDLILSWHKELAKLPNAVLFPFGDCWVDHDNIKPLIRRSAVNSKCTARNKQKAVSFICTSKQMTYGHTLRHQIYHAFNSNKGNGSQDQPLQTQYKDYHKGLPLNFVMTPPRIEKKDVMFDEYQFAIVMENCIHDNWFSEKLIDCIAKRTIPIYYGPRNIGKFFDTQGMYRFYDLPELIEILNTISHNKDSFSRCAMAADENWKRCDNMGFFQDKNFYRRVDRKIMELYQ